MSKLQQFKRYMVDNILLIKEVQVQQAELYALI